VLLVRRAVRGTVHASLLLALVATVAASGLGVSKLVLIGLLVRTVVVGVAVGETGVVGGLSLSLLLLLLLSQVARSLVHGVLLRLRCGRRILVLASRDWVRGVVARARSLAVTGLGWLLCLGTKGRLVRSAKAAGRSLLGKAGVLLLLSLRSVACRASVVAAVCIALGIRGVVRRVIVRRR